METEYSNTIYDETYLRGRYDDAYNVQIATAIVNYGNPSMTLYDHAYATTPDSTSTSPHYPSSPTSSESESPFALSYCSSNGYTSPSMTPYGSMTSEDFHYYQKVIKEEPEYHHCSIQKMIKEEPEYHHCSMYMTSDEDCRLPSVLEDIKPDLTLFPPLSPEDVNQVLRPRTMSLCGEENDLPEEVRDFCQSYLDPQYYTSEQYYEYQDSSYYTDDGYSTDMPTTTPNQSPQYVNPELLPGRDGLFQYNYTSESSDDSSSISEYRPRKQRRVNRGQVKNSKLLWQFIVDLMVDPRNRHLADWVDREDGVFRIIQSREVAELWGKEKGNPDMNYEKMSRALRFLRIGKYFVFPPKQHRRRLYFKFGPKLRHMYMHDKR